MNGKKLLIGIGAGVGLLAATASAGSYLDFDWVNQRVDTIRTTPDPTFITGTFDIMTPEPLLPGAPAWAPDDVGGYVPAALGGTEDVTVASATFELQDLAGQYAPVVVTSENGFLGTSPSQQIVLAPGVAASLVSVVQDQGNIDWKVSAIQGGFKVNWARFDVQTTQKPPVAVPDGGATIGLIGLAMLGLLAVRRRT